MELKILATLALPTLLVTACSQYSAQEAASAIPSIAAPELSEHTMKSVTRELSSDGFEERAPGTRGERTTMALRTRKCAEAVLEPGNGDDGRSAQLEWGW